MKSRTNGSKVENWHTLKKSPYWKDGLHQEIYNPATMLLKKIKVIIYSIFQHLQSSLAKKFKSQIQVLIEMM